MKNNKKGAEITLNTIIIAAIAVIVLIVLVGIFTGKIRFFGEDINIQEKAAKEKMCSFQGGYCNPECPTGSREQTRFGGWTDCVQKCCVPATT